MESFLSLLHNYREADAHEAAQNLKMIREMMERSTRHSTFTGLSGVVAGLVSVGGCLLTLQLERRGGTLEAMRVEFLGTWLSVIFLALTSDYFLTKRQARRVGKHILSRLGKQMLRALLPALGTGAVLTLYFLQRGMLAQIYPVWAMTYGAAVCAVGLFSQREVTFLGLAFLAAGAFTLLAFPAEGLKMMMLTFGGFHIFYGIAMGRREKRAK